MKFLVVTIGAFFLTASVAMAQENVQTFGTIRLEDPSTQGSTISIVPPTGIVPYSLVLPASAADGTWQLLFNVTGSMATASWAPTAFPLGNPTEIPYFNSSSSLVGNPLFTWNNTTQTLSLSGATGSSTLFSMSKTGTLTATHSTLAISNTATSSTANVNKTVLQVVASGAMGSNSAVTGLDVDVAGGTNNYAALFRNGRVGIGLGTSLPNTGIDNATDAANRELNFTGTLQTGTNLNNNFEFNTGNRSSFIRIATTGLGGDFVITGIAGGQSGKYINLYNATSETMILRHDNTSSLAANRILTPTSVDLSIPPRTGVTIQYSSVAERWYVVAAGVSSYNTFATDSKTVTTADKLLPSDRASYIIVTNNNTNNLDCDLEAGVAVGQLVCVQNSGPLTIRSVDGSLINVFGTTLSLAADASVIFIWDGSKWIQAARASG
jgi:hypothetical protein